MTGGAEPDAAVTFEPLRPKLARIAYRMLGTMADSEDIVQDAFLRWIATDRAQVREPQAFLRRIVTRLCLDQLKSARRQREVYPGEWMPEPVIEESADEPDDVTLPLMMALERLSPLERAAFLLHDVFGVAFEEVAATLGRDAAACRQLASRARANVRAARPRFDISKERGLEIAEAFFAASRNGDMSALQAMLTADVSIHSDGGGKRPASLAPIIGLDAAMKFQKSLAYFFSKQPSRLVRYAFVSGLPGFVTMEADGIVQTTAIETDGERISGIYVMRNPDKLGRVGSVAQR